MITIRETTIFRDWISRLRDGAARLRILRRIVRLGEGNPGDVRPVGRGVSEMRIDHGPGYRVYFTRRGATIVILLCGGDKSTQQADIRRAIAMVEEAPDEPEDGFGA